MRIRVVYVGQRFKDKPLAEKADDYCKRLSRFARVERVPVRDFNDPAKDAPKLLDAIGSGPNRGHVIALSEEGRQFTSVQFSQKVEQLAQNLTFVIGGPEGLHPDVKAHADELMSLSCMTFVHEMAQVFLLEQIYRAFSIIHNSKYHKA